MERKHIFTLFLVLRAALVASTPAFSQNFQGLSALENVQNAGQSIGKYAVNIAFVFCGIAGVFCLIPAIIKFAKGDGTSKDALTSVGLGLITVFVILAVVKVVWAFS